MKKIPILLAVALGAAMLMSCEQDRTVAVREDNAISFRSNLRSLTKATEVTNTNISAFKVTAIGNSANYFTDMDVAVDGSGNCTADKTYYWPSYSLGFYAYANPSGGTAAITDASKMINGVTPAAAAADQVDFVIAYENGTKAGNETSGVPLNFRHALSQVVVKAANLSTSGIVIKVKGVKIQNILNSGDFTFPAAATTGKDSGTLPQAQWTPSSTKTTYTISDATGVTLNGTAQSIMFDGAAWMIIPQALTARTSFADGTDTGSSIGVMVQILDASNNQLYPATAGEYAYTNIPIGTNWEPGKKYIYTLNFLDEANDGGAGVDDNDDPVLGLPIKFTLTVDDWVDAGLSATTVGGGSLAPHFQMLTSELPTGYNNVTAAEAQMFSDIVNAVDAEGGSYTVGSGNSSLDSMIEHFASLDGHTPTTIEVYDDIHFGMLGGMTYDLECSLETDTELGTMEIIFNIAE